MSRQPQMLAIAVLLVAVGANAKTEWTMSNGRGCVQTCATHTAPKMSPVTAGSSNDDVNYVCAGHNSENGTKIGYNYDKAGVAPVCSAYNAGGGNGDGVNFTPFVCLCTTDVVIPPDLPGAKPVAAKPKK